MEEVKKLQKKIKALNDKLDKTYHSIRDAEKLIKSIQNNCDHEFGDDMGSDFDPGDDYHSWVQFYDTFTCVKCNFVKRIKRKVVANLVDVNDWPKVSCVDHRHYPRKDYYVLTGSTLEHICPTCKVKIVVCSPKINPNHERNKGS